MAVFEIPLRPTPQALTIPLAGTTYSLVIVWNSVSQCWLVNIADEAKTPIISSIPLVDGANLLEQFDYLSIGGQLIAHVDNQPGPPNFTNLGTTGHLYFIPNN